MKERTSYGEWIWMLYHYEVQFCNAVEDITFPSCHTEEELWTSY